MRVDLLEPEAISGTIQTLDVQTVGFPPRWTADDDDPIARLQAVDDKADRLELPAVVHVEPPQLSAAALLDMNEWVRVDEPELGDNTIDRGFQGGVVLPGDRMMCLGRRTASGMR